MKTLIFGAGNLLLSDEGFGVHFINYLQNHYYHVAKNVTTSCNQNQGGMRISPMPPLRSLPLDRPAVMPRSLTDWPPYSQ